MIRLIKRYGSRKLYDTEESRYVGLEELADFVRGGQELRVVDNDNNEDVTAQTLAQIILEEGRSGRRRLSSETLHDIIRFGGKTLSAGVEQVQRGVERALDRSLERLAPVTTARDEVSRLRLRLAQLEQTLVELEASATDTTSGVAVAARATAPSGTRPGARTPSRAKPAPQSKPASKTIKTIKATKTRAETNQPGRKPSLRPTRAPVSKEEPNV
jgi:polyhydroxyalkanoate synthesis repressor PhaR